MIISDGTRRLLALCAIRIDGKSLDWSMLARVARSGGLDTLYAGVIPEDSPQATRSIQLLRRGLEVLDTCAARVDDELAAAESVDADLVTVLDKRYPPNLRLVADLPPFLFIRGRLEPRDSRAVAVVGTRQVSAAGVSRARRMSQELANHGVTITSGLAKGVDTAAHTAALAEGGRTVAVIGTGITRCYPAENRDLAEQIVDHGALVSQFWPTRAPGRDTFPRRNRVTSGISQGTVVIEASSTSGAKMQARLAHEHGKNVWLIRSLVTSQDWARKMVADGRAREITSPREVLDDLLEPAAVASSAAEIDDAASEQLMLDLG